MKKARFFELVGMLMMLVGVVSCSADSSSYGVWMALGFVIFLVGRFLE